MTQASHDRTQRAIRDLLGLISLLPFGVGKDARALLVMFGEALEAVAPVDLYYAVTDWTADGARVEVARVAQADATDRVAELRVLPTAGARSTVSPLGSIETTTLLLGHNGCRGQFTVGSRTPGFADAHALVLMQAAASIVTASLENAKALHERELANRAKDEFLALLGHELRNPLAPITTALELLSYREPTPSRELEIIGRQVEHMRKLVDDLLDIARITRGKIELHRESVPFAELVAEALETSAPAIQKRSHTVRVDTDTDIIVDADRRRLVQVLNNLLVNAVKFTPPKGHIDITAKRDGDSVLCVVRDNGAGMPPETLDQVFKSFFQGVRTLDRASGGLGIGLALVKNLVEQHGGTVQAHSDGVGRGSTFTVRLPARAARVATPPLATMADIAAAPMRHERVLVVDDNRDAADLLGELLRSSGHLVEIAYAPRAALGALTTFEATVAIVDIGLPEMSGYELAKAIRRLEPGRPLRLIALTGFGQPSDRDESAAAGFDSHLTKPVSYRALLAAITS